MMKLKKAAKILIIAFLVAIFAGVIFILSVYWGAFGHLKNNDELMDFENATASVVLSDKGEIAGRFFSENRTNISFGQIPPHLLNALIATEDVRFFTHKGIDSRSLLRVLIKSIIINDRSSGGGSTITQQLAKNMFGRQNHGPLTLPINKTKEIILARRIEKLFTKEEILTLYLNTVSFGENVFGIEAASGRYFNKKVEYLNIEEGAVLIGILKANTYYNPRLYPENALRRRNVVFQQMEKYGYIKQNKADSLSKLPMAINYTNYDYEGPADYFLVQVKTEAQLILKALQAETGEEWNIEEDGLIIKTTLDLTLQKYAVESFREHLSVMQKKLTQQYNSPSGKRILSQIVDRELKLYNLGEKAGEISLKYTFDWEGSYADSISIKDSIQRAMTLLHAGLIAMDPATGAVKTWVGGIDFRTQPYDQVLARRQIASTFKPILYTVALEEGMQPCNYLDNDSVVISGLEEEWAPQNFDHTFGGKYSLAGALVHSMNIPTFSLFINTDFSKIDSLWRRMGFSFHIFNHPSLPLGTAEANIREVAVSFASFANGGYRIDPYYIESILDPKGDVIWENKPEVPSERLMSERTNLLMNAILQRVINEGTGASIRGRYGVSLPLAGKTGTSQDYADAWFTVFNPKIIMVSRVGASSPAVHFLDGANGSGSALALPLIGITLRKLEQDPDLRKKISASFPGLPVELQDLMDCPDFKEEGFMEKILDIFENNDIQIDKETGKAQRKKKSFLRRLFGI